MLLLTASTDLAHLRIMAAREKFINVFNWSSHKISLRLVNFLATASLIFHATLCAVECTVCKLNAMATEQVQLNNK